MADMPVLLPSSITVIFLPLTWLFTQKLEKEKAAAAF